VGKRGKGPKVIPIRRGRLHPYSINKSARVRHRILAQKVRRYGATRVFQMLHAQVVLRKRTQPKARRIFKADRNWVKRRYGLGKR